MTQLHINPRNLTQRSEGWSWLLRRAKNKSSLRGSPSRNFGGTFCGQSTASQRHWFRLHQVRTGVAFKSEDKANGKVQVFGHVLHKGRPWWCFGVRFIISTVSFRWGQEMVCVKLEGFGLNTIVYPFMVGPVIIWQKLRKSGVKLLCFDCPTYKEDDFNSTRT